MRKIYETRDWDAWEEEWNRREKTEFGKTLIKLDKEMFNMFGEYDEYGMPESPLSYIKMDYFDGDNDLLRIAKRVEYKLENYDMIQEPHIKRLLNKLYRLANNPAAANESISYMNEGRHPINKKRNIKIAFIPKEINVKDVYFLSDMQFIDEASINGFIMDADNFEFSWNNLTKKYNNKDYYMRIIFN